MIFKCEICLKIFKDEFDLNTHMLFIEGLFRPFCSTDKTDYSFKFNNTKEYEKEYRKEYYSRPENIAKSKEYRNLPENKAKEKEYHKKYNTRPEVKARQSAYYKEYYSRKKGIIKT